MLYTKTCIGTKTYFSFLGKTFAYVNEHEDFTYYRFLCFRFNIKKSKSDKRLAKIEKKINLLENKNYLTNNAKLTKRSIFDECIGKIKDNTVLVVEVNNYHSELLPGIVYYFTKLGFNVDVLVYYKEFKLNPLGMYNQNEKVRVFSVGQDLTRCLLSNDIVKNYSYVYFNSDLIDYHYKKISILEYIEYSVLDRKKCIFMSHHPDKADFEKNDKVCILGNFDFNGKGRAVQVLPINFGKIRIKEKHLVTTFIVVGNIDKKRKNFQMLIDGCEQLLRDGVRNFRIIVVAKQGNFDVPERLKQHIEFKGCLSYASLYRHMMYSDFILSLLDPKIEEHIRYKKSGITGSILLMHGFRRPCIMEQSFADTYKLNLSNSVLYETNSQFAVAMKRAIYMTAQEYSRMQCALSELSMELIDDSLNNLKKIM